MSKIREVWDKDVTKVTSVAVGVTSTGLVMIRMTPFGDAILSVQDANTLSHGIIEAVKQVVEEPFVYSFKVNKSE